MRMDLVELTESVLQSAHVNGGGNTPEIIGGSLFMDMLDHTAGTVTASSAILVDANSKD